MHRLSVVAVMAVLVAVGCAPRGGDVPTEPTVAAPTTAVPAAIDGFCSGTGIRNLEFAGEDRGYLVHGPRGWDGETPLPVVYLFHGLGGQADVNAAYTGLADVADDRGFVLVAPQATGERRGWDYRSDAPDGDLAFVAALVDTVGAQDCIDGERQFAAGLSNGSALVFAMACSGELPLRGYAGVAAAFYDPSCEDAPPAPIVYFHGTADAVVPFDGGPTPIEPVEPVPTSMAGWAAHDGCSGEPEVSRLGTDVDHLVWQGCDAPLEAYYVEDGGHVWPGAAAYEPLGYTTATIDAGTVMADFFGLQ